MANSKDKTKLENTPHPKEAQNEQPSNPVGCCYEIHVKGHLNSQWSDWLEGLEMKLLDNGGMILWGPIVDQAALMGVLNKLNRLNLTILSINVVKRRNEK